MRWDRCHDRSATSSDRMAYGPAPESHCRGAGWIWPAARQGRFGHWIDGGLYHAGRDVRHAQPGHRQGAGRGDARHGRRSRRRRGRRPPGAAEMGATARRMQRAKILYALARLVQKHARLLAVLETHGQRQADPRKPRHRRAAGGAAFLLPRRPGAAAGQPNCRGMAPLGRLRRGDPVELSAADAGVEGGPRAGRRQYRGAETRRIHAADRAAVCRNHAARRVCRRAC